MADIELGDDHSANSLRDLVRKARKAKLTRRLMALAGVSGGLAERGQRQLI